MNGCLGNQKFEYVQSVIVPTGTKIRRSRNQGEFYVYIYLDPRKPGKYIYGEHEFDYEPFYVGKGKNGRAYDLKNRSTQFMGKIASITKECPPMVIKPLQNITSEHAFYMEKFFISMIGRIDLQTGPLLNFTDGGDGASNPSLHTRQLLSKTQLGRKASPATKLKLSLMRKGKKLSPEHIQRAVEGRKGFRHSITTKEKIGEISRNRSQEILNKISSSVKKSYLIPNKKREASYDKQRGVPLSEEHKRRISESLLQQSEYLSSLKKGKSLSEEHKRKISDSGKGKPPTKGRTGMPHNEETKKKIGEGGKKWFAENGSPHKGIPLSEEHRGKIRKALTGRVFTEEWIQKIKDSKKRRKEENNIGK